VPCPGSPASRTTKRTRRTRRTAQLPTPAGTELAAYRVIQEAPTNVTKHAAVDTARVRLVYRADDLLVTVANDGTAHLDSLSPPAVVTA
jgi:signal transduction histidine kinase